MNERVRLQIFWLEEQPGRKGVVAGVTVHPPRYIIPFSLIFCGSEEAGRWQVVETKLVDPSQTERLIVGLLPVGKQGRLQEGMELTEEPPSVNRGETER